VSPTRATSNSRLSIDDWIQVGYALLAEEGVKQLKIDNLCARMGATKGSFYWHFENIAGYLTALVERGVSFATKIAAFTRRSAINRRANACRG